MEQPIFVNVTEEIVNGLVRFVLHGSDYQTFCHCQNCEMEIIADVLNKTTPYYVTNNAARNEAFKQLKSAENIDRINRQIIQSIYSVGKSPNHRE